MSIKATLDVWRAAEHVSETSLLVLVRMADYANDDGSGVWPKQSTLAHDVRTTERHLRRVLGALEAAGYISKSGKRPGGVIEWTITVGLPLRALGPLDPDILSGRTPASGEPGRTRPTEQPQPPIEETSSSMTSSGTEKDEERDEGATTFPGADRYQDPKSKGAAAAPWLALELAHLIRVNDEKAKLPRAFAVTVDFFHRQAKTPEGIAPRSPEHARFLLGDGYGTKENHAWPSSAKAWLDSMRLLIDSDGRSDIHEIVEVMRWCQRDSFWRGYILSAGKFRDQYPKLLIRWREEGDGGGSKRDGNRPPSSGPSAEQMNRMAGRA